MKEWLPPLNAEFIIHGSVPGDFAFFGEHEFLLSESSCAALEEAGVRGVSHLEPVAVAKVQPKGKALPRYYRPTIVRSRTAVDEDASRIARAGTPICEECRLDGINAVGGFVLEEGSWDGTDVFVPRGIPGLVVCSERFREMVERHKLTNVSVTPTGAYLRDPLRLISSG